MEIRGFSAYREREKSSSIFAETFRRGLGPTPSSARSEYFH
jgi:hypothetical protein